MTADEIRAIVIGCLIDVAPEVDAAEVESAESFREDLDLDSMDFLAFARSLHERLGVDVPERDYPRIDALGSAAVYLAERAPAGDDP